MLNKKIIFDLIVTYVAYIMLYSALAYFIGVERILTSLLPAQIINSHLLWWTFAIKTHEGYSTEEHEKRSHNYLGAFWYWFSLGLSMHREHHLNQENHGSSYEALLSPPP